MSIINRFLMVAMEPQFKLVRDLTAMAITDGHLTAEEEEAMCTICHLEGDDVAKLMESLQVDCVKAHEEMLKDRNKKENCLRNLVKIIGADEYAAHELLRQNLKLATLTFMRNQIPM